MPSPTHDAREIRGLSVLWRRPAVEPLGGMRIAWSYLVGFLALALGFPAGYAVGNALFSSGTVCKDVEGFGCPIFTLAISAGGATIMLLALAGWWFRLGWLWTLSTVALPLAMFELVGDPASPLMLLAVASPLVAALLTDQGIPYRVVRRIIACVVGVGAMVYLGVTLLTLGN